MGAQKTKRRRNRLFGLQDGKCYWCGRAMIHWNDFHNDPQKKTKKLPTNLATLDHLRDRWHPQRHIPANGEQRLVVACWQCNFDRGKASQAEQPIELLWEQSRAYPMTLSSTTCAPSEIVEGSQS